jgi:3-oxoacyl-[acyl-carrier-protein] synthase-3
MAVELGADGNGADVLKIPAGGSAMPVNHEAVDRNLNTIRMNGGEVYKFAVRAIPMATKRVLEASDLAVDDLAWLIPHQANQRIIGTIGEALGLPAERVFSHIDHTGNTSAACILRASCGRATIWPSWDSAPGSRGAPPPSAGPRRLARWRCAPA